MYSLTKCFIEFLKLVSEIDSIEEFWDHSNGAWYEDAEIPDEIRTQRPVLMDPVNPFHNLLAIEEDDTREEFFRVYAAAARNTLQKLPDLLQPRPQQQAHQQQHPSQNNQRNARGRRQQFRRPTPKQLHQMQLQQQLQLKQQQLHTLQQLFFPHALLHNLEDHPFMLKKIAIKQVEDASVPLLPKMKLERMRGIPAYEQNHYQLLLDSLLLNVASVVAIASWGRDILGITDHSELEDVKNYFKVTIGQNAGNIFDASFSLVKDCKMSIPIGCEIIPENDSDDEESSRSSNGSFEGKHWYIKVGMNLKRKPHELTQHSFERRKLAHERRKLHLMKMESL